MREGNEVAEYLQKVFKTKFFETAGYRSQMYIKQMPIDDDIFVN